MNPHPRKYPTLVTLIRRADRGPEIAADASSIDQVQNWLLYDALKEDSILSLLEGLIWRIVSSGIPIDRVTLHVGTLHPQLLGFYWLWNSDDGLVDELKVDQAGYDLDRYKRSPLKIVIDSGERFRKRTDNQEEVDRFPLLSDLREQGIYDYCILPIGSGADYHNAITLGTKQEDGFSEAELKMLKSLLSLFGLHVERHISQRIAENVLTTYLGNVAGEKVISGTIQRGTGESIRALVWMSDLRGFSNLSDSLCEQDTLTVLNEYFERMAGAVISHGGEVLKFMGDGMLAIFPVTMEIDASQAAEASLRAASQAQEELQSLNLKPPESLQKINGWQPLKSGIGLHLGEVFFGNIGALERLDFTVIGRTVNEVSRIEGLTKNLNRSILLTQSVADVLNLPLEDMGRFELKGISGKSRVYAPK